MGATSQITALLEAADIRPNGSRPWDPQIHSEAFWTRLYAQGTLGLGEAYMDGLWDVGDMAEFFSRALGSGVKNALSLTPNLAWQIVQAKLLNMQDIAKSRRVAQIHYSETEAYKASLDKRMTGSCGYWPAGGGYGGG